MKRFNLSLATVNRALATLVSENLIDRTQGRGTFVRLKPVEKKLQKSLAVLLPYIDGAFYFKIVAGIEDVTREKGFHTILCSTYGGEDDKKTYLDRLITEQKADAFLVAPTEKYLAKNLFPKLKENDIPLILFPQIEENLKEEFDYVICDDIKGSYDAVSHLIELGHTKIGFIGCMGEYNFIFQNRLKGYKQALKDAGIPFDESLIFNTKWGVEDDSYEIGCKILKGSERATAFFAISDFLAIGFMKAAADCNVKIPEDISIVGFDDIEKASYSEIGLTTVAQPAYEIGRKVAESAILKLTGDHDKQIKTTLEAELIIRKTTALRHNRGK
jgi:LacI family transcriptional regulator